MGGSKKRVEGVEESKGSKGMGGEVEGRRVKREERIVRWIFVSATL
jgi:hypothetical protein